MTSLHPGVFASLSHRLFNALLEGFVFLALYGISKIQIDSLFFGDQAQDPHLFLIGHPDCREQGYRTEQKSSPTPAGVEPFRLCNIPCVDAAWDPYEVQERQKQHRQSVTAPSLASTNEARTEGLAGMVPVPNYAVEPEH